MAIDFHIITYQATSEPREDTKDEDRPGVEADILRLFESPGDASACEIGNHQKDAFRRHH